MPDFVQNDTACVLSITCYDQDGKPLDLTGTTVELHYYIEQNPPLFIRTMEQTDPVNGRVQYKFKSTTADDGSVEYDLATSGTLRYRVVITFADESRLTSPFDGEIVIHPTLDSEQ